MGKKQNLTISKIIKTIENHRYELKKYDVKRLGVFGSFSKGRQNRKSDLDFLVVFRKATFDNYMELKFYLEKLFARKVDLITEETLKPALEYVKNETSYIKGL
ncbi:MAG: nucleotidyltransferase family protein [Nanoarchaeota archaeon]